MAVRKFDIAFTDLVQRDAPGTFEVHLELRNEGNVPTRIRMVNVLLRWEGRLIAQGKVESLDMVALRY